MFFHHNTMLQYMMTRIRRRMFWQVYLDVSMIGFALFANPCLASSGSLTRMGAEAVASMGSAHSAGKFFAAPLTVKGGAPLVPAGERTVELSSATSLYVARFTRKRLPACVADDCWSHGVIVDHTMSNVNGNILGWEPTTPLREGIGKTYQWIKEQVAQCNLKE